MLKSVYSFFIFRLNPNISQSPFPSFSKLPLTDPEQMLYMIGPFKLFRILMFSRLTKSCDDIF